MTKLTFWLKNEDHRLLCYFNRNIKCAILDWWLPKITQFGGAVFSICLLLFLVVFAGFEMDGFIALGTSHLFAQVLKRTFTRSRPYVTVQDLYVTQNPLKDYSFPSGHTTAIFSIATSLAVTIPWLAFVLFPIAAVVGLSRIYLGLHYPTDVGMGAGIGVLFALGAHFLIVS